MLPKSRGPHGNRVANRSYGNPWATEIVPFTEIVFKSKHLEITTGFSGNRYFKSNAFGEIIGPQGGDEFNWEIVIYPWKSLFEIRGPRKSHQAPEIVITKS